MITLDTIEALNQKYTTDSSLYINIETLKKLPPSLGRLLNKELVLHSIAKSIDLTKSFTEQMGTDKSLISQEMLEKLRPLVLKKVNEEFLKNPNQPINTDYISMISDATIEQITEGQTINPQTIALLSIPQLQSLHPSILADYMIKIVDLSRPLDKQNISKNLLYFLTPQKNNKEQNEKIRSVEQSFLPQLTIKINTEFSNDPNMNLDPSYVRYINENNILNNDKQINLRIIMQMSPKQLQALNPESLKEIIQNKTTKLMLLERFAPFADVLTPEQITSIKEFTLYIPDNILKKMNLAQINALDLNKLRLSQLNALLEANNQEIILSVLKKIPDVMTLLKTSANNIAETTARNMDTFFDQLPKKELQELATESIDPEVKTMAQEILQKKFRENPLF